MNPHPALSHPMGEGEAIWGDWITQGCARSSLHPGLPSCHPYGISVWLNFNSSNMKPRRTGNTDGMNPHPGPPSDGRGSVFGRLASKVAAVQGFKARAVVRGSLSRLVHRGARGSPPGDGVKMRPRSASILGEPKEDGPSGETTFQVGRGSCRAGAAPFPCAPRLGRSLALPPLRNDWGAANLG